MNNFDQMMLMGILGYIALLAKQIPGQIFSLIKNNVSYSISTNNNNDKRYDKINEWLMGLNKKCITNNANVITRWANGLEYPVKTINYGSYLFIYNRSIISVEKYVSNAHNGDLDYIKIRIFGINAASVYESIYNYTNGGIINGLVIEVINKHGNPVRINSQYKKFDDIFSNCKQELLHHIDNWVSNKNFYIEHGLIYKTGILLYGVPGTGKTTLARAIATYLKCKITIVDFKNIKDVSELLFYVNKGTEQKVILLEDIDCICSSREDNEIESKEKEIIGVLLNILDGVYSPSNCIFIATTNHIDKLDPAIIRSGRFDCKLELKNIDKDLAISMCNRYNCNPDVLLENETFPINPSYLQSKILNTIK